MAELLSPANEECVARTVSFNHGIIWSKRFANSHPVNRDDYISKFRMSAMSDEEIRGSTVTG